MGDECPDIEPQDWVSPETDIGWTVGAEDIP